MHLGLFTKWGILKGSCTFFTSMINRLRRIWDGFQALTRKFRHPNILDEFLCNIVSLTQFITYSTEYHILPLWGILTSLMKRLSYGVTRLLGIFLKDMKISCFNSCNTFVYNVDKVWNKLFISQTRHIEKIIGHYFELCIGSGKTPYSLIFLYIQTIPKIYDTYIIINSV